MTIWGRLLKDIFALFGTHIYNICIKKDKNVLKQTSLLGHKKIDKKIEIVTILLYYM